jgi:PAS domain S-box-containing protein
MTTTRPPHRRVLAWTTAGLAVGSVLGNVLARTSLHQLGAALLVVGAVALLLARPSPRVRRPSTESAGHTPSTGNHRAIRSEPDPAPATDRPSQEPPVPVGGRAEPQDLAPDRRTALAETQWRQLLEVAPEPYVAVDASGRVVGWNRRAESLFGYTRQEAVGMSSAVLVGTDTETRFPPPHDLPEGRVPEPVDVEAVDRHGRRFWAEFTVWAVERRGGAVVHTFVRDVSEERRAQHTAALLQAVVEGSCDAIVTCDLAGTILTWNRGAEQIHGWSAAEVVGRKDTLVVPPDKQAELDVMVRRLRSGEQIDEVQTERLTRAGTRLHVSLRLSPVHDAAGRLVAVSAIARDVTEQRWMAQTLDTTLVALQRAADEARASEAASRRFLADAAHQLRTPVAGIRACAETLLRGPSSEDSDRLLATMVRETSRAGRLISSLLRMARLDHGLPLSRGPVDVVTLCEHEVERLNLFSPELDVRLQVRQAPLDLLLLDGPACREVLSNLGDNARRHAAGRIDVVVDGDDQEVRIAVCDDGPGVPDDARERVFERFVSLDGRGGSGLGLPVGRALARAMGGDLHYEGGFLLRLPAQRQGPPNGAVTVPAVMRG